MTKIQLDPHSEMLMEEYYQQLPLMKQLKEVVDQKLKESIQQSGIETMGIEARIKAENSLAGKLRRKGMKYATLNDITDILGVRIITFYNEDVDKIASIAESTFEVDWKNSIDKRNAHQFDSFGYNSLHYICRLKDETCDQLGQPQFKKIWFELQMRTALQHVWSVIQHDIGYKSAIETPLEYHRNLSRLAGLLELADNEFSRVRTGITNYRRRIQSLVREGQFEEVLLDADSWHSYMEKKPFDELTDRIAAFNQAEIYPMPNEKYLTALKLMGMKTLGDVERMLANDAELAYQLSLSQLGATDLDIISSTLALQNLCIVHIIRNGGGKADLRKFMEKIYGVGINNDALIEDAITIVNKLLESMDA